MGLAEQQRLLARLYTDAAFRERFLADPRGQGEILGLAPTDVEQLSGLSPQQVGFFARSLYRKRLGDVRKLLPATHQALGSTFGALFRRFVGTSGPTGARKHRNDALAFASFLQRDRSVPGGIADVARYEEGWLRAADPDRRCIIRWFRFPVRRILRGLAEGTPPDVLVPGRTLAIWLRPSRTARLRHGIWSFPAFRRPAPRRPPTAVAPAGGDGVGGGG